HTRWPRDWSSDVCSSDLDLPAIAETILSNDPDAVALQELTGAEQLKILLGYLHGRYRGAVAPPGNSDRVDAVLVKDRDAGFESRSEERRVGKECRGRGWR